MIHRGTLGFLILIMGCFNAWGQVNVQMKSFNSFKPAKAKVQAIEQGLTEVSQMLDEERPVKDFGAQIVQLEGMVDEVRKEFKRYKRLPEWDEKLVQLNARTDVLFAKEQALKQAKRKANEAKAQAARDKNMATMEVRDVMWKTKIEDQVGYFKRKPSFRYANEVVKAWATVGKKLEAFRTLNPGEKIEVKNILEIEAYLKDGFQTASLELLKNQAPKDDATIEEMWEEKPDNAIKRLAPRISFQKAMVEQFPQETQFASGLTSSEQQYKELITYRDGGGWAAWKMDQIRIPAAEGRNSGIESQIKKALIKEGYEVMLVRITDANWYINKNEYGIPKHKEKSVVCAVKKDGKCMRIFGNFRKSYAGGGTYNSTGYYRWNDPVEMNCANVK